MSNLNFMVCPHDTATDPDRWFRFVQYLAQKLDIHINFELSLDFADFHAQVEKADIAYANPTDTLKLVSAGLSALVHPSNVHDEVVFVANKDLENPTLETLQGVEIASVEALQPTKLALHILHERNIQPAGIQNHESWTAVVGSIWRGESNYGLLYKDTYNELSEQGKSMINDFYTSDERIAFHNILVGRNAEPQKDAIQQTLLAMHSDEKGKDVMQELRFEQWLATTQDELDAMKRLIETY
jgi:ABC-type phosphate/phosphonate transport system substrate-binding protein